MINKRYLKISTSHFPHTCATPFCTLRGHTNHFTWQSQMSRYRKYDTACKNSCVRSPVVLGGSFSVGKLLKWHPLSISAWAWKWQISDTKPLSQIGCVEEKKQLGLSGCFLLFFKYAHKGTTRLQIKCLWAHWTAPETPLPPNLSHVRILGPTIFKTLQNWQSNWQWHQLYAAIGKVWTLFGLSQDAIPWMSLRIMALWWLSFDPTFECDHAELLNA